MKEECSKRCMWRGLKLCSLIRHLAIMLVLLYPWLVPISVSQFVWNSEKEKKCKLSNQPEESFLDQITLLWFICADKAWPKMSSVLSLKQIPPTIIPHSHAYLVSCHIFGTCHIPSSQEVPLALRLDHNGTPQYFVSLLWRNELSKPFLLSLWVNIIHWICY